MLNALLKSLVRLLLRLRLSGHLSELARGRPLVMASHNSAIDALLVAMFLPGRPLIVLPRALAGSRIARWLPRFAECAELGPGGNASVKGLLRALRSGRPVVVFPQDRVTTTGGPMKVYGLAALLASRGDADILPLRIEGTQYTRWAALGCQWPKRMLPPVRLVLQPSVRLTARSAAVAARRRQQAGELLQILQRSMANAAPRRTLIEALLDAAQLHGRRMEVIEDLRGQVRSYNDLIKGAFALGRLCEPFTRPGERVGVMLPNLGATVCLVFGLAARGRVAAMLNYSSGAEALRVAVQAATLRTVITSRAFLQTAKLEHLLESLSGCDIVYLEDLRERLRLADKLWVLRAMLRPRAALPPQDPGAPAIVLFTSGSEARPKGVVISHDTMLGVMAQLQSVIEFGPEDKYLNALPMYHTFGLIACTLMPLVTGTRLFLYTNPLHYKLIPEYAYTRDCTYIFGTSTFLGNYARQADPYDFYRVRFAIAGGEKLNTEVSKLWFEKFGLRVYEGYGATECGPAMALNTPLAFRAGSVGRFLPGVEYRIVPVPGIEQGGVLHVCGPNLMTGYLFSDAPGVLQPPRSELGAGWYNTGDVVSLDDDGFVTIHGRVKRFAKIAGEMVSLERVEQIAYQASPAFKHAALVEMTRGGESTLLLTTDPALDRMALIQAARQIKAHELAVAKRIVKVDHLPLLGSGKVDYVTLKQQSLQI